MHQAGKLTDSVDDHGMMGSRVVEMARRRCRSERGVENLARTSNELDVEMVQTAAFTCDRKIGSPAQKLCHVDGKPSRAALRGTVCSPNSRWSINTPHRVLPGRPLPQLNSKWAPRGLSIWVGRATEVIQPRVKVVQVSGARGRQPRENARWGRGGAGVRTVIESLYAACDEKTAKTIEAVARSIRRGAV